MRITLYRLRKGIALSKDVLRDADQYDEIDVSPPSGGASWMLFVRAGYPRLASWVENVVPILQDASALDGMKTQSSGGVLLVGYLVGCSP